MDNGNREHRDPRDNLHRPHARNYGLHVGLPDLSMLAGSTLWHLPLKAVVLPLAYQTNMLSSSLVLQSLQNDNFNLVCISYK